MSLISGVNRLRPFAPFEIDAAANAMRLQPGMESDAADLAVAADGLRVYVPPTGPDVSLRLTPVAAADDADFITITVGPGVTYEPIAISRIWSTGWINLFCHGVEILLLRR